MFRLRIVLLDNNCIEYFVTSVFVTGMALTFTDYEGETHLWDLSRFKHFKVVKYKEKQ